MVDGPSIRRRPGEHVGRRDPVREVRSSFTLRGLAAAGGLAATLLTTVVAVRGLESREAAAFLAVLAGLMIGPMFGKLGLGQNVIRLLPTESDPERRRRMVGAHLRAATLLAVVSAPLLAFVSTVALLGRPGHTVALLATSVVLVAETLRLLLSDVFAATGDVLASVATTHHVRTVVVLPALLLVVVVSPRPSLSAMLLVYAAVTVVLLIGALVRARGAVSWFASSDRHPLARTLLVGLAVFVLDAAVFVVGRGDVWLAAAAFAPFEATLYGTVSVLAFQVTVLYGLASLAISPVVARLWAAGQRAAVFRLLSAAATLTTAITAAIVVGLALLGGVVLGIAYGPAFTAGHALLLALAIGGLGQAAFGFSVPLLLASGGIRRAVVASLLVLVVAVPIGIAGALWWGPFALAVSSGLAAIALPAAQWLAARRVHRGAPLPSWRVIEAVRVLRSSTLEPAASRP